MTVQLNQEKYQSDRLKFERKMFESEVYKDHFLHCLHDSLSLEELCEHSTDSDYERKEISAMWHGWKLAKGIA